jgi:uncharacterized protein (DUF3084 family)
MRTDETAIDGFKLIERERDEARETLAATLRAWQAAQEKIIAVTTQRDEAREQLDRGLKENRDLWSSNAELTEQRDRLAEALRSIKNELGVPQPEYPAPVANAVKIADAALQSLATNAKP